METLSKRGLISKISSKRGVLLVGVNIKRVHGAWVSENEFIPTSNTTFIDSTSISKFETARRSGFFLLQQWHLKSNHLGIGVCNDTLRNLDHYGFLGKTKWSFSWNKQKGNHHLFSEFTFVEMKFKCVMGALFHPHPTFRFGAFFSKVQIDQSPSGFLQSFRQQLEWQVHSAIIVYAGVSLQKKWSSDISTDFFKRLFFVECEWKPKRNHQFYYRGFKEQQMVFLPWENTYQVTHIADLTHRVDAEIPIGNAFQFHTRFEFSHKERLKKRAQYYFFELDYHPFVIPVSCVFRYTSFDADDWNMRRFVMERGVSGSYNMRSLYGVGERLSVLMKWKPGKVNVQCKVYWQDHFQRTYLNRWASNGFGTRRVGVECLVAVELG